jgi:hypothetical protein
MIMSGNNNSISSFNDSQKRSAARRPRCVTLATTLDLHGYRKDGAMSELTSFLEGHRVAGTTASVMVITGTGSHSSDMGGPVLRSAVQSLLERREMEFSRNTAGSFLVKAQSGVTWFSQQSTSEDTKVIVRDGNDDDIRIQQAVAKAARNRQQRQHQYVRQSSAPMNLTGTQLLTAGALGTTGSSARALLSAGPSLKEVARSEAEWNSAKDESMELARHHNKQNTKEERELQRVLSASEEELRRIEEEEKERFDQAVALSKRGELLEQRDDERLLQNALAESQQEETLAREALVVHEQELEQAFQDALASSLADAAADGTDHGEQDEEELEQAFQDALTMSLADAAAGDTDPHEQDEEERMMQLALKLSMQ